MCSADRRRPALALLLGALLGPLGVSAAEYPPGPLSDAHASLEGLASCTACHVVRDRASPRGCLACHPEIAVRLERRAGPHGRTAQPERGCGACHPEHWGRDVHLIDWGPQGRDRYDHAATGWPLSGAHARTACAACHRRDRIEDAVVRKVLEARPRRQTLLGAPATCRGCHADRHRGQLSPACETCHGDRAWRPADRFSHAKTAYPLAGKHEKVLCHLCHFFEFAPVASCPPPYACPPPEPWAPAGERAIRYRPIPHDACERCHANTHAVRFSDPCAACHVVEGWLKISEERFVPKHAQTRYPLAGAHVKASCRSCHGPWKGEKPRFIGLPFRACSDCHADAHARQLGTPPRQDCGACHDLAAFKPVRYVLADHAKTRYPLVGAHRAVACVACHPELPEIRSRVAPEVRSELARQARPVRSSGVELVLSRRRLFERCDGCHKNPHGERNMAARIAREGCAGCHLPETFRIARFDHSKTAFPLVGKHLETDCASCHPRATEGGAQVVRYSGVPKFCGGCHDDVHAGQLGVEAPERTACDRCHETAAGWKKTRFVHQPPFTEYRLEGRHAPVKCERCHFKVAAGGREIVRYRPLPARCDACHEDEHRGAFDGFEPAGPRGGRGSESRCEGCHDLTSWASRRFAHERTSFALTGGHREVACGACHAGGHRGRRSSACGSCHADVHVGQLGARCERCHGTDDWLPTDPQLAHRRTNFPLVGRHATIPCQECHFDRRDFGYARGTVACGSCHERQYAQARTRSLDHQASGLSTDCRPCHGPYGFRPGLFLAHEACFQIQAPPHAGIACGACHARVAGLVATGACFTGNAMCTRCHGCASIAPRHATVAGYACADRKCYECHSFVR